MRRSFVYSIFLMIITCTAVPLSICSSLGHLSTLVDTGPIVNTVRDDGSMPSAPRTKTNTTNTNSSLANGNVANTHRYDRRIHGGGGDSNRFALGSDDLFRTIDKHSMKGRPTGTGDPGKDVRMALATGRQVI